MRRYHASILIVTLMLSTLLAFLIVNSDSTISDTVIGEGHITLDTVWDLSNSTYYIEGNITVDYGVNLTIEPGVEVKFNGFYNLYIEGNLSAVGNSSKPIIFTSNSTSPGPRNWSSVQINKTGYAEIKYCNITYANYGISISESSFENDIQNNIISNNWMGVRIYDSLNNTIKNNNISDNYNHGTFLSYSSGNNIQDNYLSNNGKLGIGNGLHLHYSSYNAILNNDIWNNNYRGIYLFWSNSNEMRYNRIYSNLYDGIYITQSSDNKIRNNNISLNGYLGNYPGVNLTSSTQNNRIFHNTLIENANQAFDATNNSNQWDDGYPSGGNYWSDYSGVDEKRGENQDVPGSDGIGDDPYAIDNNSRDNYPLMNKSRDIAPYLFALIAPYNNSVIKAGTFIDLHILVLEFNKVNYSINGAGNFTLDEPWDINTTGWSDGGNRIDVYVNDTSGNVNSSWFFFIVDSTKPIIELISPLNNSVINTGEIINISISDPYIKSTHYYVNGGPEQDLLFPYDINTSLWPDGTHSLEILAEDVVGNVNSTLYVFTLDSSPPVISLSFPVNNSYIKPGTQINFSISDEHPDTSSISYFTNGQGPQSFSTPYFIDTIEWDDENYIIEVNAADILGNSIIKSFNITIDSIPPSVILHHPLNNSVIKNSTLLNFSVFDASPFYFRYSLNFGNILNLLPPYDMDISSESDGNYIINVNVTDYAGNYNLSWYNITIDSTGPIISLLSLSNNSSIRAGTEIAFEIVDPAGRSLQYRNPRGGFNWQ
jgi:parallel beta-helix repeat protein